MWLARRCKVLATPEFPWPCHRNQSQAGSIVLLLCFTSVPNAGATQCGTEQHSKPQGRKGKSKLPLAKQEEKETGLTKQEEKETGLFVSRVRSPGCEFVKWCFSGKG